MYNTSDWGIGTKAGGKIKMPATLREPADSLPPVLANLRKSKNGIWCLGKAAEDEQFYRDYIGGYYALVSEVDYYVGEILKALKETGLEENTIIVYTSDHGDFAGGHGMIEKAALGHNVYEETIKVPLIFSWKNHIKKGILNENLVGTIDVFPTLIELTGIKMPEIKWPLQGISLAQTLIGNKAVGRKYIVTENWSQATVVTDKYKLGIMLDPTAAAKNRDFRAFGDMLFDVKNDPGEVKNLAGKTAFAAIENELREYYNMFTSTVSDAGKKQIIEKIQVNNAKK